ncbi:MAG: DUF4124 domain-containing protein [Porticoccaceae bacterium]|nr:DUF4124 domain-containing protein [Porticoccaceae bacterium]
MLSNCNKFTFHQSLLILVLVLFANFSVAEIYRWKDENGNLSFSDQPPKSVNQLAEVIGIEGLLSEDQRFKALENEIGRVELKNVAHGQYQQYIPEGGLNNFKIVVVNHGMFSAAETAPESARNTLRRWQRFANKNKAIIVAPVFDNANYAVTVRGARNGGYRGLYGRHVGADAFLHEILREYQLANHQFDGRFYLSGHSAGAQFANRYLVRHPQRVIAAAFSAPAWFAQPSSEHQWPYGMGRRKFMVQWPREVQKKKIDIQPNPNGWLLATQRPVAVVVGVLDLKPMRHVQGIGGDTHVGRAKHWVKAMNKYASQFGENSQIKIELVPGVGHNYGKLAGECQVFLANYM